MISSFKTCVLDVAESWTTGKGYNSSQLLGEGIWTTKERWQRVWPLHIHRHLVFADSSFPVALREKQFVHLIRIPTRKTVSYQMIDADWLFLIFFLSIV